MQFVLFVFGIDYLRIIMVAVDNHTSFSVISVGVQSFSALDPEVHVIF